MPISARYEEGKSSRIERPSHGLPAAAICVATGVVVGEGVRVGVVVAEAVAVDVWVGVGEEVGVSVTEAVGDLVALGVAVPVGVAVGVGVPNNDPSVRDRYTSVPSAASRMSTSSASISFFIV